MLAVFTVGLQAASALNVSPGGGGDRWLVEAADPNDNVIAVRVNGTPYQMGWWYGKLLATEIRDNLNNLFAYSGMSEPEMQWLLDQTIWPRLSPHIPQDFHDELQGIVDGAQAANPPASPAITLTDLRRMIVLVEFTGLECTSICAVGPATHDGRLIQLRVLDTTMQSGGQDNPVITVYVPESGPAYCNVGFAGLTGSLAGMNSAGIAMSEVGVHTPDVDLNDPNTHVMYNGIPMAMLMKKVLAQATAGTHGSALDKAIEIIETGPRTSNYSYGVGDAAIRDAVSIVTSRARSQQWGVNTAVTIHRTWDPNSLWIFDPNDYSSDGYWSGFDPVLPAIPGVTYIPNDVNKCLDLLDPCSPNYVGPLESNVAMAIAKLTSSNGGNLLNVVFDGQDLKLWAAYAEGTSQRAADRGFVEFDFSAAIQTHTVTVRTNYDAWGQVQVTPDAPSHFSGRQVSVSAAAASGCVFRGWLGDVPEANATDNPLTLVPDGDKTLQAIFAPEIPIDPNHIKWRWGGSSEWHFCGAGVGTFLMSTVIGLGFLRPRRRR